MTAALLFVHGTSVREDGVERGRARFSERFRPVDVHAPAWGVRFGMDRATDFSLTLPPGSREAGPLGAPTIGDDGYQAAARLTVLMDDPLLELRVAADQSGPLTPVIALPGGDGDDRLARDLAAAADVDLDGTGLVAADLQAAGARLLAERHVLEVVTQLEGGMPLISDALLAAASPTPSRRAVHSTPCRQPRRQRSATASSP